MSARKAAVRWPASQPARPAEVPAPDAPQASIHVFEATRERLAAAGRPDEARARPESDLDPVSGMMVAVAISLALWGVVIVAIAIL
jgi:hypothetical protein